MSRYRQGAGVLDGAYAWLEQGILEHSFAAPPRDAPRKQEVPVEV